MPTVIKDKDYWKEYNKKNDRKEYMRNLMKEKRVNKKLVANENRVANNNSSFSVANTKLKPFANKLDNIPVANILEVASSSENNSVANIPTTKPILKVANKVEVEKVGVVANRTEKEKELVKPENVLNPEPVAEEEPKIFKPDRELARTDIRYEPTKENIHQFCENGRAFKYGTAPEFIMAHKWYEGKKDQYWSYFGCKQ